MTGAANGVLAGCTVLILLLVYRVTSLERRLDRAERWVSTIATRLLVLTRRIDDGVPPRKDDGDEGSNE